MLIAAYAMAGNTGDLITCHQRSSCQIPLPRKLKILHTIIQQPQIDPTKLLERDGVEQLMYNPGNREDSSLKKNLQELCELHSLQTQSKQESALTKTPAAPVLLLC